MSNTKKSILIYFDNFPMLTALPPEQRGWLLTVLMVYGEQICRDAAVTLEEIMGQFPQLSSEARLVCGFMGANIRRDTQRWLSRQRSTARPGKGMVPGPAPRPAPEAEQRMREDMDRARRLLKQAMEETDAER